MSPMARILRPPPPPYLKSFSVKSEKLWKTRPVSKKSTPSIELHTGNLYSAFKTTRFLSWKRPVVNPRKGLFTSRVASL